MALPEGFLWGGVVPAGQYEGGWDEGGRGPCRMGYTTGGTRTSPRYATYVIADGRSVKADREARLPKGAHWASLPGCYYPNQVAVDGYHRIDEDIELMAEMGFKVFRMSIGWSRLYPTRVKPSPSRGLLATCMQPLRGSAGKGAPSSSSVAWLAVLRASRPSRGTLVGSP